MKRTGTLVASAVAAALASAHAQAGDTSGTWYVAPSVYALWLDDSRQADDDVGVSLAFGRTLNPQWDVELGTFLSKHDRADNGSLELKGLQLQAKRVFYRGEARVNPFLSVGLANVRSSLAGDDDAEFTATYGVGLLIDLSPSRNDGRAIALRGDLGARRAFSGQAGTGDTVDYIAGVGLQFSWGGTPTPRIVDMDGDGVTDEFDNCPGTPAGTAVDSAGCALPLDDDGDGVTNDLDKCPGTPAGAKVDAVGCEVVVDGDADGDGILDSQDKCPDTPKGERVDATGCPFNQELLLQGVKFQTNSAELLPESVPVLDRAVATLKRYPELKIEVAGYTDSRGSDAYNLQLSARRAETVLKYLRDGGVSNALTSHGYGEQEPIASNDSDDGRQQNRRVVLRVAN
jgi:OmpA-OmpF porin, OOP family